MANSSTSTTTTPPLTTELATTTENPFDLAAKHGALHGDTSFVIICAALVFFMTPGLGYFYSGMARSNSALSLILLCFLSMAVVLIQWTLFGASLAFSETGNFFIGNFRYAGGRLIGSQDISASMQSVAFFIFQGMFATITPALIFGSCAERIRFLPSCFFIFIWTTVVYDPIACWTWSANGWLFKLGALDYAGGGPVHMASGFAGLAMSLAIGKRKGFEKSKEWKPHNISSVFLGTAILWFGWFGFNGGSAIAGTSRAAMAAAVTCIAAASSGLTWVLFDYRHEQKLSGLGFCCGAVAGLVGITPASGFVEPWAAIVIGFVTGLLCNLGCHLKHMLGYDDALDVFGTHGLGGFLGNILTGIFAQSRIALLDGQEIPGGWLNGNWIQVGYQMAASVAIAAWSFLLTFIICFAMQKIPYMHLRLKEADEIAGMDFATMGETHYTVNLPGSASSDKSIISHGPGYNPPFNRPRKIEPVIVKR